MITVLLQLCISVILVVNKTMPAIQRSEFTLALNQVAAERGVDTSVVVDTVKNAILAAYRKDHVTEETDEYTVSLNPNTGEARILLDGKDVTPPGFGRIAAQTAKQVILQKIREKEKEAILSDYAVKVGTIINGMILRFAGSNIIVDIGKTEAIMPPQEQIAQEKYHLNQRLAFYLVDIRDNGKGKEIIVSRSNPGLLEGLFKREVPEIAQNSVSIKEIAREAGSRAKVAVASNQAGIDPVGSCVGQKGVRVQAVIQELGGIEKIDVIQWQEDPVLYIQQALSPAKDIRIELDEKEKLAHVFVPQDSLSLAIGREGQNVRLASKLTGYRIEIEGKEEPVKKTADKKAEQVEEKPEETPVEEKEETEAVAEPVQEQAEEQTTGAEQSSEEGQDTTTEKEDETTEEKTITQDTAEEEKAA